jgi:hypothetical protein
MATVAAGPLFFGAGFLNTRGGGDSPFLLFRLHQIVAALADGQFPVRWMPDAAFGLGYPFFSYYAALPYYVAALFVLGGLRLIAAIELTQWLGFLLAAWSMWGLVRALGGRRTAALLAAAAYTFAPYHLVNVYVRGDALSEFWAMGWYPLTLWTAARVCQRPGFRPIASLAISYAALVLTHNVSALIFTPFMLLFVVLLATRTRTARTFWKLAGGLVLALALSAWYWLPALLEQNAVQLTAQTTGYLNFDNHFRYLSGLGDRLLQPRWIFNYDLAGPTPFSMGAVQAFVTGGGALVAVSLLWRRRRPRRLSWLLPVYGLVGLVLSSFMILPLSTWIWQRLPLLPMAQFPWRFFSVQALFSALLIAGVGAYLPRVVYRSLGCPEDPVARSRGLRRRVLDWAPTLVVALALAVASMVGLRPDYIWLTDADITPSTLQLYEWFSGNIGTTIRYEYLPRAVAPRPLTSAMLDGEPAARVTAGTATVEPLIRRTGREDWRVQVTTGQATVSFPTYYWPGWRAWVDGQPASVYPADSLGTLTLEVPAGSHEVLLALGSTPARTVGGIVSAAAGLLCMVMGIHWRAPVRRRPEGKRRACAALLVPVLILLAGWIVRQIPAREVPGDDLTWDFDQQPYLHHNPDGIRFGDAALLQRYEVVREPAEPDLQPTAAKPVEVTLFWDHVAEPGLEVELALVNPAQVVHRIPYTLTAVRRPLVGQVTVVALEPTQPIPPGPMLLRLRVLDYEEKPIPALTSSGNARGDLYLAPIQVAEPDEYQAHDDRVQLLSTTATALTPESIAVWLEWGVGEIVAANHKLSLRLVDEAGYLWAALDEQPGYGFYPTSLWQAGTRFWERLVLAVPYGLPPGQFTLQVVLYDAATLQPKWGPEERPLVLTEYAAYDGRPVRHQFSSSLAAAGLEAPAGLAQGEQLSFVVTWAALQETTAALVVRWELVQPPGEVAAGGECDLDTAWPSSSLVLGRCAGTVDRAALPGEATLRLTVLERASGEPLGAAWDATTLMIREQVRQFDMPALETAVGAEYGQLVRLEGYDLDRGGGRLSLTLYWRCLQAMQTDYVVFVHLVDPATEVIVAQSDLMPRNNQYTTSRWMSGEVVDDRVNLALEQVPAGRYRLAVGLYSRVGDQFLRLPAIDQAGHMLPDGRLFLPADVILP